jgi:hypothetical protein
MSDQQNPQEWPTREQMERVQELAADGMTVKVERHGAAMVKLTAGAYGGAARYFDVDGGDVTARETRPFSMDGVSIPLDAVAAVLGADVVRAAVDAAVESGADHPSYRVGAYLGDAFIAALAGPRTERDYMLAIRALARDAVASGFGRDGVVSDVAQWAIGDTCEVSA